MRVNYESKEAFALNEVEFSFKSHRKIAIEILSSVTSNQRTNDFYFKTPLIP